MKQPAELVHMKADVLKNPSNGQNSTCELYVYCGNLNYILYCSIEEE